MRDDENLVKNTITKLNFNNESSSFPSTTVYTRLEYSLSTKITHVTWELSRISLLTLILIHLNKTIFKMLNIGILNGRRFIWGDFWMSDLWYCMELIFV